MLSFPSQTEKKNSDRPDVLETTDPGNGKPTYFKAWPNYPLLLMSLGYALQLTNVCHSIIKDASVNLHETYMKVYMILYSKR